MVDGPDTLQVGFAPGRLRSFEVGVDLNVVRKELVVLCCRRALRRGRLTESYRDSDSTESQNPFDHVKTPHCVLSISVPNHITSPFLERACKERACKTSIPSDNGSSP